MNNEIKQTAVQWFAMALYENGFLTGNGDKIQELLEKAKEMEKERIETAYNKGTVHGIDYPESTLPITGEQYYNENYGGNK